MKMSVALQVSENPSTNVLLSSLAPAAAAAAATLRLRPLNLNTSTYGCLLTVLSTLSVIGVGVRLAVCLKGATIEKSLFCGLRNQYAPKN